MKIMNSVLPGQVPAAMPGNKLTERVRLKVFQDSSIQTIPEILCAAGVRQLAGVIAANAIDNCDLRFKCLIDVENSDLVCIPCQPVTAFFPACCSNKSRSLERGYYAIEILYRNLLTLCNIFLENPGAGLIKSYIEHCPYSVPYSGIIFHLKLFMSKIQIPYTGSKFNNYFVSDFHHAKYLTGGLMSRSLRSIVHKPGPVLKPAERIRKVPVLYLFLYSYYHYLTCKAYHSSRTKFDLLFC